MDFTVKEFSNMVPAEAESTISVMFAEARAQGDKCVKEALKTPTDIYNNQGQAYVYIPRQRKLFATLRSLNDRIPLVTEYGIYGKESKKRDSWLLYPTGHWSIQAKKAFCKGFVTYLRSKGFHAEVQIRE